MIVARLEKPDGKPSILLVLEPGNIEKIKMGDPIVKDLGEFGIKQSVEIVIGFSPDVTWVAQRVKAGVPFLDALRDSMTRREVFVRPQEAEEVKRVL